MATPMPNDTIDGLTVIASVLFRDEDDEDFEIWTVLLLRPEAPFFQVAEVHVTSDGTQKIEIASAPEWNIVPAVETYKQWGGDH